MRYRKSPIGCRLTGVLPVDALVPDRIVMYYVLLLCKIQRKCVTLTANNQTEKKKKRCSVKAEKSHPGFR